MSKLSSDLMHLNATFILSILISHSNVLDLTFVGYFSVNATTPVLWPSRTAGTISLRDAMKLQVAALCGTASTNFLNLMQNFYGVEEEEEEGALEDVVSFAAFVKQHRKEREKEKATQKLSVSKASDEKNEFCEEEEEEDIEDSASTTSSTTKRKTLKQLKASLTINL